MSVTSADFDQLLAQAEQRRRAQALAEQERDQEQRRINRARFRAAFPLTPEEQQALGIEFYTYSNSPEAYASIPNVWGNEYVIISQSGARPGLWQAEVYRGKGNASRRIVHTNPEQLRDELVLAIAAYRQECEEDLAKKAEAERVQAAQAEAEQQRRDLAIAARQAELLAEHTAIAAEVETIVEAARAAAWQWPAGVGLTLYRWRWQLAAAVDADGYLTAEYDEGWSTQAEPDAQGFVFFQPGFGRPKGLAIKPITVVAVERHTFAGVADLPDGLLIDDALTIPGIGHHHGYHDEPFRTAEGDRFSLSAPDGGPVLVRDEHKGLRVELGKAPRAWVRALVEQAASDDAARGRYIHIVATH